ncbi:MAG TPA: YihY/virulence factor BrkB family protein [Verrucomicrobiales bacterium]|jgi:membrane protein|nr:YihY/virulence factor BrkB family protein [Verrucomicrobiales bacterium]
MSVRALARKYREALQKRTEALMRFRPFRILRDAIRKWMGSNIMHLSAALAFYATFSLAPLLVIILSIAGWTAGDEMVREQLYTQLSDLMGPRASMTVREMTDHVFRPGRSTLAAVIGIGTVIFGATSLFTELQHSLNRIWHTPDKPPPEGIIPWLQGRLLSAGMVLVVLFLLLASLLFTALFSAASGFMASHLHFSLPVWGVMGFIIALGGEMLLFSVIFKVLPHVKLRWKDVWWGAITTALLFEGGKWVVGWYLGSGLVAYAYGTAGSIVLLLLWVYYSAIIVLTGAVLTQVRANDRELSPVKPVDLMATGPSGPVRTKKGRP